MKQILLAALLGASIHCTAQQTQISRPDAAREANFLYEVKIIDEFIERFNDDPTSALRKAYLRAGKNITFTREDLLRALFDQPAAVKEPAAQTFLSQVADPLHPQLLSFNDTAWYAEVQCAFNCGGRKLSIPLVLQVSTAADKSSKWMIAGIGNSPVFMEDGGKPAARADAKAPHFISPSDYATNFLELQRVLGAGITADSFFVPELMATEKCRKFVQLIQSKKLTLDYPGTIKFYFFQIPNYTFTVERFVRNTAHSGWLITALQPATDAEKQDRKSRLLQRTL